MTDPTLRGTDWAQIVCDTITRGFRSKTARATVARTIAGVGDFTDEARQVLRDYADRQVSA